MATQPKYPRETRPPMTTPYKEITLQEVVADTLDRNDFVLIYGDNVGDGYFNDYAKPAAAVAIEALREGAIERANAATLNGDGFPMVMNEHRDAIINAILGPPLATEENKWH